MASSKFVFLTGSEDKAREYAHILGRYGVRPQFLTPDEDLDAQAARLLDEGAAYVVREESYLRHRGGLPLTRFDSACVAINVSNLTVWSWKGREQMSHEIEGYIDAVKGEFPRTHDRWFGWDSVFISTRVGLSYRDAVALDLKASARDMVLGKLISNTLRYDGLVDLNWAPLKPSAPVDFELHPSTFLQKSLAGPVLEKFRGSTLDRVLGSILTGGIFFRSARSRRDRNYWAPGLNGGVPLVPKKDGIHELTFMVHDMLHWASPDLIFDGRSDERYRTTYILHRMIGEAVSLVMADYLFVDALRRSGVDYDWSKRAIHPLFHSIDPHGRAHEDAEFLKAMCRANTRYALLGDDNALVAMGADAQALEAYKAKYTRFFVEDYRWTAKNWERMVQAEGVSGLFTAWSEAIAPHLGDVSSQTISDFLRMRRVSDLGSRHLATDVEEIFEATWKDGYAGRMRHPGTAEVRPHQAQERAMRRYLIGQSILCWRYAHVGSVKAMGEAMLRGLADAEYADDYELLRELHEAVVDHLVHCSAVSEEDGEIFRAAVPIFDPFFVFYESKSSEITTLPQVLETIFPFQDVTVPPRAEQGGPA